MYNMQYERSRGLASAAQQFQHQRQYSYPQPLPQPNANYYQQNYRTMTSSQTPYSDPAPGQTANYQQLPQVRSPYSPGHAPLAPPQISNPGYRGPQPSQYPQQQNLYEVAPPLPQRRQTPPENQVAPSSSYQLQPQSPYEQTPPLPQRSKNHDYFPMPPSIDQQPYQNAPVQGLSGYVSSTTGYIPPPQHQASFPVNDDPSDPTHYTRDPHKLVGYLVPFPKPQIAGIDPSTIPTRFLIYTPPPPPLSKPKEGEKEAKLHKVQRKWQEEVRSAKTSTAPIKTWKGVKSRATKAIAWGVNQTTTSNLEFLGRVSDGNTTPTNESPSSSPTGGGPPSPPLPKKTVGVDELLLVYPPALHLNNEQMREEFVNTMLRTKTKAQRDSIIATGLLPVSYGIDILATLVWPFGGLGEIDTVWLYSSIRGAKTAGSVTKRLGSSAEDTLHLNFVSSARLDVLTHYLEAECHRIDSVKFPVYRSPPTETEVLEAIGWHPAQTGGEQKNWEDEQWEMTEVKDDVKSNMHKGAKEWKKFCVRFEKDPEKALKK